jgi:hypothetical protein
MIALGETRPLLARFEAALGGDPIRVDLRGVSDADREAARLTWAGRIVDEYRSVVVFSELLGALAELEAPFSTLATVQTLVGDELAHTRLCAGAAEALGGMADLDVDLADLALPPATEGRASRALEIVLRELVVAETASVHILREYRDATEEPALRALFDRILRDEVRHAAAGFALLDVLVASYPRRVFGSVIERLPEIVAGDLEYVSDVYRSGDVDPRGRTLGASIDAGAIERALTRARGRLSGLLTYVHVE